MIARDDRKVSKALRLSWESEDVEWIKTSEQGTMLDTELPQSLLPILTISRIESWLSEEPSARIPYRDIAIARDALVTKSPNGYPVRETFVEMGTRELFGVVCEPVGESRGPLIVMVNGINEDHVGPSRLWVELSRRWAGYGLRTVRFDFRGIGESPPDVERTRGELERYSAALRPRRCHSCARSNRPLRNGVDRIVLRLAAGT